MAKRPNQRLKLLYLAKIMLRLTDDEHGLQVSMSWPSMTLRQRERVYILI